MSFKNFTEVLKTQRMCMDRLHQVGEININDEEFVAVSVNICPWLHWVHFDIQAHLNRGVQQNACRQQSDLDADGSCANPSSSYFSYITQSKLQHILYDTVYAKTQRYGLALGSVLGRYLKKLQLILRMAQTWIKGVPRWLRKSFGEMIVLSQGKDWTLSYCARPDIRPMAKPWPN